MALSNPLTLFSEEFHSEDSTWYWMQRYSPPCHICPKLWVFHLVKKAEQCEIQRQTRQPLLEIWYCLAENGNLRCQTWLRKPPCSQRSPHWCFSQNGLFVRMDGAKRENSDQSLHCKHWEAHKPGYFNCPLFLWMYVLVAFISVQFIKHLP